MTAENRALHNLTDYFMRASHSTLADHVHLIGCELIARQLRGDALAFELSRLLRRQTSAPRAEPLARPS